MALISTADVKTILGITGTTYDTQIAFFIPLVEKDIIDYLGHAFQDKYVYIESGSAFAFLQGDSDTADRITVTEESFIANKFADGMDIVVEGGGANVGKYTISSASTGTLKMTEYGTFIPQDQLNDDSDNYIGRIRISRVKWPDALKLPAAKMVWYLIDQSKPDDVQSESLDDYSISYAGSNAYPNRVLRMLDKYRKPVFI